MKFNCGPTPQEKWDAKFARLTDWHPFFTLVPRRVGSNDCRWLETIERKGKWVSGWDGGFWFWEYRAP